MAEKCIMLCSKSGKRGFSRKRFDAAEYPDADLSTVESIREFMNRSGFARVEFYDEDGYNLHNEDGPAFVSGDAAYWYVHGTLHRTDGPAEIVKIFSSFPPMASIETYHINGVNITEEEFAEFTEWRKENHNDGDYPEEWDYLLLGFGRR